MQKKNVASKKWGAKIIWCIREDSGRVTENNSTSKYCNDGLYNNAEILPECSK